MFEVVYFVVSTIIGISVFEDVVVPATLQVVGAVKPVVDQAVNFVNPT